MSSEEVWFVAKGSQGFTHDQDQAVCDAKGVPVIAGGVVRRIVSVANERISSVMGKKVDILWDQLFFADDRWQEDKANAYWRGSRDGLIAAIAIIQHGNSGVNSIALVTEELNSASTDEPDSPEAPPEVLGEPGCGRRDGEAVSASDDAGGEAVRDQQRAPDEAAQATRKDV